jgi:membrane protease YdiL (CAAX protease family)
LGAYALWVRGIERRPVHELTGAGALRECLAGCALGVGLIAALVAMLWATGSYRVQAVHGWAHGQTALAMAVVAGVVEELLFRGLLMRWLMGWVGAHGALAGTALLFGLAHLGNPSGSWLSAAAIALEAGVMLGACYLLTRRLWLPIGVHLGWNFGQSGLFGLHTSGAALEGMVTAQVQGPTWWTGGSFGPEASVPAVLLCLACSVWMLRCIGRREGWP